MQWITLLVLALASNLDNLGIGVGLGLKRVRLPWTSNALIAGVAALATAVAACGGRTVALILPQRMANLLGGMLIVVIGAWVAWSGGQNPSSDTPNRPTDQDGRRTSTFLRDVFRTPSSADTDKSGAISWKEALLLGIALGLNCLAGGFAAGLTGFSAAGIVILTAVFSYVLTDLGVRLGRYAGQQWFGRYSHLISGFLLVALGLYECLA
ncbi:MAG: sporulation membrane protein YtaF [Kyrpidia sp.]|nr:sporulation membrane protein YtaF [Kyrpidia sp.]